MRGGCDWLVRPSGSEQQTQVKGKGEILEETRLSVCQQEE